jgi:hypothetical protein
MMITQRVRDPETGEPVATETEPTTTLTGRRVVAAAPPVVAYRPARPAGWTAGHLFIRLVWLVVGVIDAIVGLDFVFRLIAARDTGFAHVIMVAGSTLASPFDGIFASVPRFSNLTLQWSDLLVFLLAIAGGWVLTGLVALAMRGSRGPAPV